MRKINTKLLLFLSITLLLFTSSINDRYHQSLAQLEQQQEISSEKKNELKKLEKLETQLVNTIVTVEEKDQICQDDAIAIERLKQQLITVQLAEQTVVHNRWQNWQAKKFQLQQLINRTNRHLSL